MQLLASFSSYSSGDIYNRILSSNFEGQSGKDMCQGGKPELHHMVTLMVVYVCGSAYENGCIVDGSGLSIIMIINLSLDSQAT